MKVLIADFDNDTIKNFITFIKQNYTQIKAFASVTNTSKNFLSIVAKEAPSLIIADVRFFGASSLKVIRDVGERYPDVKFVLYGTYNETEYMQRCVQFGVIDYMYRPVKPKEFGRCMDMALDFLKKQQVLREENSKFLQSYKENLMYFEEIFLTSLINGNIRSEREIQYSFEYFNIKLVPNYTVFVIRIDHFQKIILTMNETEKHMYSYKILMSLRDILSGHNAKVFMNILNSFNVILSSELDYESIIDLCNDIKNALLEKNSVRVTIGVGRTYEKESEISISYKEAESSLNYRFYMGHNTVISIDFAEPSNNVTHRYPTKKEERLVYFSVIGEYDYCKQLLDDIFNSLRKCGTLPDRLLPKIIMNILISISCYANELRLPLESEMTVFFPSKEVFALDTIDKAYEFMDSGLKKFCEYILQIHKESNTKTAKAVKTYILDNYHEPFSITKLALQFHTTPEYLDSIFMENEKASLLDFTINIRMEEAKRLALDRIQDDELIALKIGYENGKHFRSIFKQHTGMNISDFRIRNNVD